VDYVTPWLNYDGVFAGLAAICRAQLGPIPGAPHDAIDGNPGIADLCRRVVFRFPAVWLRLQFPIWDGADHQPSDGDGLDHDAIRGIRRQRWALSQREQL